jgi:hypothetical protein
LEDAKTFGREALELLAEQGRFPWRHDPAPSQLSAAELTEHLDGQQEFRAGAESRVPAPETAPPKPPARQLSVYDDAERPLICPWRHS